MFSWTLKRLCAGTPNLDHFLDFTMTDSLCPQHALFLAICDLSQTCWSPHLEFSFLEYHSHNTPKRYHFLNIIWDSIYIMEAWLCGIMDFTNWMFCLFPSVFVCYEGVVETRKKIQGTNLPPAKKKFREILHIPFQNDVFDGKGHWNLFRSCSSLLTSIMREVKTPSRRK